jgi:hypothetical protein
VGFVLDFDARNNLLRLTIEGTLTDAIVFDIREAVARYAASHPPFRGIVDTAQVTEYAVSSDAIREIATAPRSSQPSNMWIVVTPKEHIYGMTRMFQIVSEKRQTDFHVVRTMDEAYRLLCVESPEFDRAS